MGRGTAPWQVGGWEPRHTVEGGWVRVHRGRGEQWRRPVMPRCGAGAQSPRRAGVSREPGAEGGPQGGWHDSHFGASDGDKELPPPCPAHPLQPLHAYTASHSPGHPPPVGTGAPRVIRKADAEPGGQEMPGSAELRHSQPMGWSSGKVKGRWARDPLGLGHSCACPEGGLSPTAPPPQRLPPSSSMGLSAIPLPAQAGRACACHQQCPCAQGGQSSSRAHGQNPSTGSQPWGNKCSVLITALL